MSDQSRNARLMEWFAEGVALDPQQRTALVERVRTTDPALAAELAELLEVEARGLEGFLSEPVVAPPRDLETAFEGASAATGETRPPQIDGYRDMVLIGEGGMGSVYRVQQYSPMRRTVAIKVIRGGLDSRTVLQRFEAERLALARMAHPYIATIHDAGTDRTGRPFLSMEFVDGQPITQFCQSENLGLEERLELCAKVCEAVDHAHRRGVLHRDLKPNNVLVTRVDGVATPKIIDFGIAKATEGKLAERTLLTEHGACLGTPEYMSPEQLDGDLSAADTRTDVYALGAMLYEIITGTLPLESQRLRAHSLTRMASMVRSEVPPKPSTRLRAIAAAANPEQPAPGETQWAPRVGGDLDWVVMKAIDKDPEQRYATPRALADDLRRFLDRLPVEAGPPSGVYRVKRFVRRYRIQVVAGLMVLVSLIAGLFGTLWFLFEARSNASEANTRAAEATAMERRATGSRIAAEAALATENDPNLALQLAIEGGRYHDAYAVANSILGALPTHDLLAAMRLRDHEAQSVEFLADGRLLVRTHDLVFWLVDLPNSRVLRRYDGHTEVITSMDVAVEQGAVLTASLDATARVWDVETGDCRAVLDHDHPVTAAAWAPDRSCFATRSSNGSVRVYDSPSLALRHELGSNEEWAGFDFHPREPRLLLHTTAGAAEIRDLDSGAVLRQLPAPTGSESAKAAVARFGPSGERIVRVAIYRTHPITVEVMDLDGAVLSQHERGELLLGPITDPMVLLTAEHALQIDLQSGRTVARTPMQDARLLLGRSPDHSTYVAVDTQEDLALFDAITGERRRDLAGRSDKRWDGLRVAFHPDGQRFAVTGREVRLWAVEPEYAMLQLPVDRLREARDQLTSIAVMDDEALGLIQKTTGDRREWHLWSLDQRRELRVLEAPGVDRLTLAMDGTRLIGATRLAATAEAPARTRYSILDLEGRLLHQRVVEGTSRTSPIHPNGTSIAVLGPKASGSRRIQLIDVATGQAGPALQTEAPVFHFNRALGHPYGAAVFGDATRTDFYDLTTGEMVRSIRGPTGASQFYEAVDPIHRRLLVLFGDLRVRSYELDRSPPAHTGEYSRLVRSNTYRVEFVPNSELAWAKCANEVHLFHGVTCRPFAVFRLDARADFVAARPDGSELITATETGACHHWPLDPEAVARRKVVGRLDRRTLELLEIDTPEQRDARERARLLAAPTPRGWAQLGEHAIQDGDLDQAIDCYQASCSMGLLGKSDRRHYVRLLELLCQRMAATDEAATLTSDAKAAIEALQHCLRCKVPRDDILALPGVDTLLSTPAARRLLDD